nr:hypothetical protein [Limimaricola sp. G21655-S1]
MIGQLTVTDPDAGDTHSFTVSDTRFEVVNGALKLREGVGLDFEEAYSIPLIITATDADGLSLAQDFEIAVQDVAEGRLSAVTNVVEGSNAGESLKGAKANDLIVGLGGKDTLIGRKGDDIMAGGKGADRFVGGKGFDTLDYSDSAKGVTVNLQKGVAKGGDARGDKFKSMEGVIGSDANDKLLGSKAGNVLIGGAGADTLNGRGGKDRLDGGAGNDKVVGGGGADTFIFDLGNDKLVGGGGRDTVEFDGASGDYDVTFGKKVVVTFEDDRDVLIGMERLEFDDVTYTRQGGEWVEVG